MDQFAAVTRDTGRLNDDLWPKMLIRVGQVAGKEALNDWLEQDFEGFETHAQQALYGWAMKDPQAAGEWYLNTEGIRDRLHGELLSRVIGGIALMNPGELTKFAASLSEDEQVRSVGHSVWNLMKNGWNRGSEPMVG